VDCRRVSEKKNESAGHIGGGGGGAPTTGPGKFVKKRRQILSVGEKNKKKIRDHDL